MSASQIEGDIVVTEKDYFAGTKVPTWNDLPTYNTRSPEVMEALDV